MKTDLFGLVVRFDLKPQAAQAFDDLALETLQAVKRQEPETLIYACHAVDGDDYARVFYELYADRAAFDLHEAQTHTRRFLAERQQHLAHTPRVEFLNPVAAKGLPEKLGGQ